ncbi:MAG: ferrous iron transport protein B [Deltaproteobacteria bacterium]|nr:ferrous iron transport protein B [Deltaproteobacteria bacterium]
MKNITIALAGNPNSGKTTLFNAMTGAHQYVGNWAGVTVEKKEGRFTHKGYTVNVIDLPGTYSLSPYSMEEIVARNYLLEAKPDVVVQVVDASNLERNLFLTSQLLELERPLVLALNVFDALEREGAKLDVDRLSKLFGAPAVPTIGTKGKGVDELIDAAIGVIEARESTRRNVHIPYGNEIEDHIGEIRAQKGFDRIVNGHAPRWTAIKLLENDRELIKSLQKANGDAQPLLDKAAQVRTHLFDMFKTDPEIVITERRYGFISGALKGIYQPPIRDRVNMSDLIDQILTHKLLGLPVFFFMIWAMFQLTFNVGSIPMDLIDAGVAALGGAVTSLLGEGFFRDLIVDGAINGVGFVAIFLPNILILFFCISLIEDSGYMARAAFLMDRVMRLAGLHGKAFIPMLMGFGCNVPAVMATRTLESERDRIVTILVNPLMSCSARLPVFILLAGTFFAPSMAGNMIFSMYALGIVLAISIAKLMSRTVLKGEASPFVMELPPYRMPTVKSTMIHMWDRGKIFIKKMGGVILIGSVTVWVLTAFPREAANPSRDWNAQIEAMNTRIAAAPETEKAALADELALLEVGREGERIEQSFIGRIGHLLAPAFAPMGFDWKTSVAILTGFVAKEIVVSTYGVLYQVSREADENTESLRSELKNNSGLTPLTAFALMTFILIYTPCLGTVAAIRRETGSWKWTGFSIAYSLVLAWVLAAAIVQVGRFAGLA